MKITFNNFSQNRTSIVGYNASLIFKDSSVNNASLISGRFLSNSVNNGFVSYSAFFTDSASNNGIVTTGYFYGNSLNLGSVQNVVSGYVDLPASLVSNLSTNDIAALTTSDLLNFTTDKIQGLTSEQIPALTANQIISFTTIQLNGLTSNQLNSISTGQINNIITTKFPEIDLLNDANIFNENKSLLGISNQSIPNLLSNILNLDSDSYLVFDSGEEF